MITKLRMGYWENPPVWSVRQWSLWRPVYFGGEEQPPKTPPLRNRIFSRFKKVFLPFLTMVSGFTGGYLTPRPPESAPTHSSGSVSGARPDASIRLGMFPEIEPYKTFRLKVSDIHDLYVEEAGNPKGQPVIFLHGGPGAEITPEHRRLFDPKFYRIILFDQRGSGKSTPYGELRDNTTWHLVEDIEKIRKQLGIQKWMVFGGSWGSALGMAYAESHPDHVSGLILRGVTLGLAEENPWLFQGLGPKNQAGGADMLFPKEFEQFKNAVPPDKRANILAGFEKLLNDPLTCKEAARAWQSWGPYQLVNPPSEYAQKEISEADVANARLSCRYYVNNMFLAPDQLIRPENIQKLAHIPTWIINGRYDIVCPTRSAFVLHQALPHSKLSIIEDAGHAFDEPGILDALIRATEEFKKMGSTP